VFLGPNGKLPDAEEKHMAEDLTQLWVGVNAGKAHHWLVAVDDAGATIWSKNVPRTTQGPDPLLRIRPLTW
jgi:hypothetical protein